MAAIPALHGSLAERGLRTGLEKEMTMLLIGVAVGLIVGWNLLPQPAWVERIYDAIAEKYSRDQ